MVPSLGPSSTQEPPRSTQRFPENSEARLENKKKVPSTADLGHKCPSQLPTAHPHPLPHPIPTHPRNILTPSSCNMYTYGVSPTSKQHAHLDQDSISGKLHVRGICLLRYLWLRLPHDSCLVDFDTLN